MSRANKSFPKRCRPINPAVSYIDMNFFATIIKGLWSGGKGLEKKHKTNLKT